MIKVVPFFYLTKVNQPMSFTVTADREDTIISQIKVIQKTMDSVDSYQVFEFGNGDLALFRLNLNDLEGVDTWQIDKLMDKAAPMFLKEEGANEMDPNLILIRLGRPDTSAATTYNSTPISSVKDGQNFIVKYLRKDFP